MSAMSAMTYEALRALFERSCFTTTCGPHKYHEESGESGDSDGREPRVLVSGTKKAFVVAYMDWGGMRFLSRWLKDENKRSYERIEHSCVRKEDQLKSIYYAFPEIRHERLMSSSTDEQKRANVEHFLDYVLFLVGNEHLEWMVTWLADIIVNPHDKGKNPVAVVLCGYGEHGLRDLMEQLLGKRLVLGVSSASRWTGNAELKYKLFVEFEDVDLRADRRTAARIRATITERTRAIANSTYVTASERVLITTSHACNVESGPMFVTFIAAPRRGCSDEPLSRGTSHWGARFRDPSYVKDVAEYLLLHMQGSRRVTSAHLDFRARTEDGA